MKWTIKKAVNGEDAETIARLGRRAFYDTFVNLFNSKSELASYLDYTYSASRLRESISKANNVFFLAWNGDTPAGFAKLKKRSPHTLLKEEAVAELQKIYVLQAFQGCGAGQVLLEAAVKEAAGGDAGQLWLDVHVANNRAQRFYEKNGFAHVGNHHFLIGSQLFYYHVMALPIAVTI